MKNVFYFTAPFFLNAILQILALAVYVNYISPEQFGIYALTCFVANIVLGFSSFGLITVYQRNYFKYDSQKEKDDLLFSIITFIIFNILVFGFLIWNISPLVSEYIFNTEIKNYIVLLGITYIGFKQLNQFFYTYYKNIRNGKKFMYFNLSESVISFIFSCFFLIFLKLELIGLLLGQSISVFLIFIVQSILYFNFGTNYLNKKILHESIILGLPLSPSNIVKSFGSQFDRYIINLTDSLGNVGIYDIGSKISNLSFMFSTSLQSIFQPNILERYFSKDKKMIKEIGQYLTPFFYLSSFFCVINILFAKEILIIISAEEYLNAVPVIVILSLLYSCHFFLKQPQLLFAKKTGIISILSIGNILLNIIMNYPFVKLFGMIGAAYSTFICGMLHIFLFFYYSQKYSKVFWENRKMISIYFYVLFSGILTLFLFYNTYGLGLNIIIKSCIIVIYLLMGYFFKIVNYKYILKNLKFINLYIKNEKVLHKNFKKLK